MLEGPIAILGPTYGRTQGYLVIALPNTQGYFRCCSLFTIRPHQTIQSIVKSISSLQCLCEDPSLFGSCSQDLSLFGSCTSNTQGYLSPSASRTQGYFGFYPIRIQGSPWVLHTNGPKFILGPAACRTQSDLGIDLVRTQGYFGSCTWEDPGLFWVLPNLDARLYGSCPG